MITKEQAETYKDKYLEYMATNGVGDWNIQKREADAYAQSFMPGVNMDEKKSKAFRVVRDKNQMDAEDEIVLQMWREIGARMSTLARRQTSGATTVTPTQAVSEIKQQGYTAYLIVKRWVESNQFIPTPSCLAHFGNFDASSFSRAMGQLREEGYVFDRVGRAGYKVSRPVIEKPEVKQDPPATTTQQVDAEQIAVIVAAVMKAMQK